MKTELQEILNLDKEIFDLDSKLESLKDAYATKNSPIKKGDRVNILWMDGSIRTNGIVKKVEFDIHHPFYSYYVKPYTKDFSRHKKQSNILVSDPVNIKKI